MVNNWTGLYVFVKWIFQLYMLEISMKQVEAEKMSLNTTYVLHLWNNLNVIGCI